MKCRHCGTTVRFFERNCSACDEDAGYPNVRAAEDPREREALEARLLLAEADTAERNCLGTLQRFRKAVQASVAVVCCTLSRAKALVESDNELYTTFYNLVDSGARRPEVTDIERERLIADDLLFPHYRRHIRFASLSIDGFGVTAYGQCSLTLKPLAIAHRATVFETNSLFFCRTRGLLTWNGIPEGYRASWAERDVLAAAKLASALTTTTSDVEFACLLINGPDSRASQDFIEVHIYGPLHRESVSSLRIRQPLSAADQVLAEDLQQRAQGLAIASGTP